MLFGWVLMAAALIWAGFAAVGLRSVEVAAQVRMLERIQAAGVLLAIFSVVIGAIWTLRAIDLFPGYRVPARPGLTGRLVPAGAAAVAAVVLPAASFGDGPSLLAPVVAWSAFLAGLAVLGPLSQAPVTRAYTLTAFAAVALFQLTVGWLHLLRPTGPLTAALIVQGLLLAWTAIAASREIGAVQRVIRLDAEAPAVTLESARQPLPEPAVGH